MSPQSRAVFRVLVPVGLLALVLVPLTRALTELSHEVRARTTLSRLVTEEPLLADAIRFEPVFDRGALRVHAVVVGSEVQAQQLQARVSRALASVMGGEVPTVQVRAIPQPTAADRAPEVRRRVAPEAVVPTVAESSRLVHAAVAQAVVPIAPADALLDTGTSVRADGSLHLRLAMVDTPLDARAIDILARALTAALGTPVGVDSIGVPVTPMTAPLAGGAAWASEVERHLTEVDGFPALVACVTMPTGPRASASTMLAQVRERVGTRLAAWPAARARVTDGPTWSFAVRRDRCETAPGTTASGR